MSRPSISRTLKAMAAIGIKPASVLIHVDGSFEILTDAPKSAPDLAIQRMSERIASRRQKTG